MNYRIVILNGDQKGERVEVTGNPLSLGRAPACSIPLNDAALEPIHARLLMEAETLVIRATAPENRLRVNDVRVPESPLNHGDIVEIGTTRFLVQQFGRNPLDKLSKGHGKRFLAILVLVLLVTCIILTTRRCTTPAPEPAKPPHPHFVIALTNAAYQEDLLVTNIPPIRIHPSIVLTSSPPDVVEAITLLGALKTNTYPDISISREALEYATFFLEKAGTIPAREPPAARDQAETDFKNLERGYGFGSSTNKTPASTPSQ